MRRWSSGMLWWTLWYVFSDGLCVGSVWLLTRIRARVKKIDADLLEMLVSNLSRLDEKEEGDRNTVYHTLSTYLLFYTFLATTQ